MDTNKKPRILFFDVETTPVKAWIWRTGKQVLRHDQIVEGQKFDIICIAYRWQHSPKIYSLQWNLAKQDSSKMINDFAKVIESADVVIGQNSDSFDIKQINTQRLLHRQPPISWPTSEDTRKQIKKHFYVTSSSLEYMSKLLTGSGKDKMAFQDWIDIIDKHSALALKKMVRYCKRDVQKLYEVWKRIAPYVTIKASRAVIANTGQEACPSCASKLTRKYGFRVTRTGKKQRMQCYSCAHTFELASS